MAARFTRRRVVVALVGAFGWLVLLHLWQARGHVAPWLFPDEVQYTQLARSVAGVQAGPTPGPPHSIPTLYSVLIAPAWLLTDNAHDAYLVARYLGVVVMVAAVFPAYGLARLFAPRLPALWAAVTSVAVPATAYSSLLIEESIAYTYSTLAVFACAKAFLAGSRRWALFATLLAGGAILVRTELVVLPVAAAGTVAIGLVRRRLGASTRRAAIVAVGAALLVASAVYVLDRSSHSWRVAESHPGRVVEYAAWAFGALVIGIGVIPLLAAAGAFAGADDPRERRVHVFLAALAICLLAYTGIKAAYLSTFEGGLIEERNLIYLCPLILAGAAGWLAQRRIKPVAVLSAAALGTALVLLTPYRLNLSLYSDALGLADLEYIGSHLGLGGAELAGALVAVTVVYAVAAFTVRRDPQRRRVLALVTALVVLVWCGTGELAAASASNSASRIVLSELPFDPTWIDAAADHEPAIYLANDLNTLTAAYELEFWNASLGSVWKLSGSAPLGPGMRTATLTTSSGTLAPPTGARYVLADPGVDLVGHVVAQQLLWRLYRVVPPIRLVDHTRGIYPDGWMSRQSSYIRFQPLRGARLELTLARPAWAARARPVTFTVAAGPLALRGGRPRPLRTSFVRRVTIQSRPRTILLPPTARPFVVTVSANSTFHPTTLGHPDPRSLSAILHYGILRAATCAESVRHLRRGGGCRAGAAR